MKYFVGALALALLATVGCASLSDGKIIRPISKLAVVSIIANDRLYYVGDQPPQANLLTAATSMTTNQGQGNATANKLLEKTDQFLAKGEESFIDAISKIKKDSLLSKSELIASAAYQNAKEDTINTLVSLKPQGYKFVKYADASLAQSLAKDLNVNGSVYVNFIFQKYFTFGVAGTGSMGAQTTIHVQVYDKSGNMIFTDNYIGKSKNTVAAVTNIYDPDQFVPVGYESIQAAIDQFVTKVSQ